MGGVQPVHTLPQGIDCIGSVHQSNYSFQCDDSWPRGYIMSQCHRSIDILMYAICYARSSLYIHVAVIREPFFAITLQHNSVVRQKS